MSLGEPHIISYKQTLLLRCRGLSRCYHRWFLFLLEETNAKDVELDDVILVIKDHRFRILPLLHPPAIDAGEGLRLHIIFCDVDSMKSPTAGRVSEEVGVTQEYQEVVAVAEE